MSVSRNLQEKTKTAAKWSFATEVIAKIISPVTQMVLARLLAPEAFGMVATVTMVVNFADMFSDAGFQKYLVQHPFSDDGQLYRSANVAFWTNLTVSIILWALVALFNEPVAAFVGSPNLGFPLVVACLSLPMTAFSSIQMAIFHRKLNFRPLLPARVVSTALNFLVTVGLALIGFGYWSLIVGTLAGNMVNAVVLTALSDWRPKPFYSLGLLKEMISFSAWTLLESFTIWLSTWAGTFIVGNALNATDLGYYRTPITFVTGCFSIVTGATTPILFSSLSRLQSDEKGYRSYFQEFQFTIALFVIPLSAGLFAFREPLVLLLLGDQWGDASLMFGLYGLVQGPMVLLSYYSSEMYRSLGRPRVSTLVQVAFLVCTVPIMTKAASVGYDAVVLGDALSRCLLIIINQVVTYLVVGISFFSTLQSLREPMLGTVAMSFFIYLTYGHVTGSWLALAIDVLGCVAVYFSACMIFPKSRGAIIGIVRNMGLR